MPRFKLNNLGLLNLLKECESCHFCSQPNVSHLSEVVIYSEKSVSWRVVNLTLV